MKTDLPAKKTLERSANVGEIIKAKELIDVLSPAGLTTASRRTYNLLIAAAHENLADPNYEHVIALKELRGSDESNAQLKEALDQLMTTVIVVRVEGATGRAADRRVQLLGGNDTELKRDGVFRYRFDPKLVEVLKESSIYAQLKKNVIWAFSSKYAMALYEVVERRHNMDYITAETFTLEEFRYLLDVQPGKYQRFAQLNQSVIQAAVKEVNHLCDFLVEVIPMKAGRKVTALTLQWRAKSEEEIAEARAELKRSRVGRKERREGNVVTLEARNAERRETIIEQLSAPLDLIEDEIVF